MLPLAARIMFILVGFDSRLDFRNGTEIETKIEAPGSIPSVRCD
jgi:hypothetical protein